MQRAMSKLHINTVTGAALAPHVEALARLRLTVFAEWPYLYDGVESDEERYLGNYANSPGAAIVMALDGAVVVGAATCQPMLEAAPGVRACGLDAATHAYFGESVLLPKYRGRGAGVAFFVAREAHARALGLPHAAFCAVVRNPNDPRWPADYVPLDGFWRKRGYTPRPEHSCIMQWAEPGDAGRETPHSLGFWTRAL